LATKDSVTDNKHDTQSPSELERGDLSHEKEDAQGLPDHIPNDAGSSPRAGKGAATEVNAVDWNGDDDPDNPYNCAKFIFILHKTT
jgi:hypothetical protein